MPSTLTDALLDPILAADPAGPRITYYDDATGERVELSALTLANWAAKTANLLRDELGVQPGDRVAVLLPAHWQTAAVFLGIWWAGGEVALGDDLSGVEVALVTADRLDEVDAVGEVAALSLDAFGRPVADLPVGITDYASTVRVHGDQFRSAGAGAALGGAEVDEVVRSAAAEAQRLGLTPTDRVLSTAAWDTPEAVVTNLLAVLAAGASLVQVAHPADQTRRVESEKVTRQLAG
ncbi:TIGR03089 family protein [Rhodococcus triatomae]|uniref:TIGR03089 family protein n=1 Tax=Rhodococcus triatomae TaxID=300028 RepID=A0A1G8FCP4_9NOCA|nr:TIGR03089 family protein [Rhodococcus triatomae]QNG19451.1 TIGR03089 family protein [Rhodococcus triatomae]QNG24635.1 TIGR03089 family protein [Rhodococcus triatomae]SDH79928.1 TIGR03089 family protein [Rhodococcus triatomae]